jgi:hypothetical protein
MSAARTAPDEPTETRGTEPVETVDYAELSEELRQAREAGQTPPAGRLLGLPELAGDVWVDIAGATAVTGLPQRTITSWLARGGPKALPFPSAHRFLYRNYWPAKELEEWKRSYDDIRNTR